MLVRITTIIFILITMAQSALASLVTVQNVQELRYQHNGTRYVITPQIFNAKCKQGKCIFNANGLTLAVSENLLHRLDGSQSDPMTLRKMSYSRSTRSEVSQDENFSSPPTASYSADYSNMGSSLAQCFKNKGREYSTKRGCRSGNRKKCRGYKAPEVSTNFCYRYVKLILQDCGATRGYLGGAWAKNAGPRLAESGFKKLNTINPDEAPIGSIIVYSNHCLTTHPAGHIEIKTSSREYISDYISSLPRSRVTSCRRVKGIYFKN